MSRRTTAEIIADLRGRNGTPSLSIQGEAADRLAELIPVETHFHALMDEMLALEAKMPPCLACDGTGMEPRNFSDTPCRSCGDGHTCGTGKVSIEKLVALWKVVHDTDVSSWDENVADAFGLLRQIGGEAPVVS